MKFKDLLFCLILFVQLALVSCKQGGDNSTQTALLVMFLYDDEVPADLYFDLGFPGSPNSVTDNSFSGNASDYSVTIGGQAATGISFTDPTTLQFTMPLLAGMNENANVIMTILENGLPFMEKTVRYRSLTTIPVNQPHGFSNMISTRDKSNFYSFTVSSSGDHIFNAFGYSSTDVDIYYKVNPGDVSIPIAQNGGMNAEFKKFNISSGSYILEIRYVSGKRTRNYVQIANGLISAVHTTNEVGTYLRCYDFLSGAATASPTNCYNQNNPIANYIRTGRCTYPSARGLTTRSYYIRNSDGYGFTTGYADVTCTQPGFGSYNEADAIFENN